MVQWRANTVIICWLGPMSNSVQIQIDYFVMPAQGVARADTVPKRSHHPLGFSMHYNRIRIATASPSRLRFSYEIMGNICFGGAEGKKANALAEAKDSDVTDRQSATIVGAGDQLQQFQQQQQQQHASSSDTAAAAASSQGILSQQNLGAAANDPSSSTASFTGNTSSAVSPADEKAAEERFKAVQEEQARLELIVQATGRGMVSVRSQRGSTGYYDQGFAAALAQHLEQTTNFPERLNVPLPPPCSNAYACLVQPDWEGVALGNKDGENPEAYLDHIAELFLDAATQKKERLFANVAPIMENLL